MSSPTLSAHIAYTGLEGQDGGSAVSASAAGKGKNAYPLTVQILSGKGVPYLKGSAGKCYPGRKH